MKELNKHEQQVAEQAKNISLPDKNLAWQRMKKLLDEEDDKGAGFFKLFRGLNGWLLGTLFCLLTLGGTTFLFLSKKNNNSIDFNTTKTIGSSNKKNNSSAEKNNVPNPVLDYAAKTKTNGNSNPENNDSSSAVLSQHGDKAAIIKNEISTADKQNSSISPVKGRNSSKINSINVSGVITDEERKNLSGTTQSKIVTGKAQKGRAGSKMDPGSVDGIDNIRDNDVTADVQKSSIRKGNKKGKINSSVSNGETDEIISGANVSTSDDEQLTGFQKRDPLSYRKKIKSKTTAKTNIGIDEEGLADNTDLFNINDTPSLILSRTLLPEDSIVVINTAANKMINLNFADKTKKKDSNQLKYPLWTAGLGLQQGIGLYCNCTYPDNKSTVSAVDYIPSGFVRYYPVKNWFVQFEFKYAAPQLINEFMYRSQLINQPYNVVATTYVLREAYYNQFHLSADYMPVKNLLVGAGVTYNAFSSAITQQTVLKKPYGMPDSLISFTIIRDKNQQNAVYFTDFIQWHVEAEYKWKRFYIGARFAQALPPYVKFIDPFAIAPAEKKSNTLIAFVKYELWRRKKK
ncbi:hypothetical protein [Ferruginibacter albus]|uniref:hypothetical protein n=1 Tax=Ferruginibacter albus TaxID=2875540 RepID=UPI001CC7E47B|nr:hypothetical protein [Ferruginibacter albus]UAY50959.1 hypothetical protein K9M53_10200 [Ferruginibacter albus]